MERRKVRELQDASRERDKEYQKLKAQYDRVKRKALLAPNAIAPDVSSNVHGIGATGAAAIDRLGSEEQLRRQRAAAPLGVPAGNISAFVGGMEAAGVQRTPIVNRTTSASILGGHQASGWQQQSSYQRLTTQRRPFAPNDRSLAPSISISDRSDSGNEVEAMVLGTSRHQNVRSGTPWANDNKARHPNRVVAPPSAKRSSGSFRPAGMVR